MLLTTFSPLIGQCEFERERERVERKKERDRNRARKRLRCSCRGAPCGRAKFPMVATMTGRPREEARCYRERTKR